MVSPIAIPLFALARVVESFQHLLGFAIVLLTLLILWGATAALGSWFQKQAIRAQSSREVSNEALKPTANEPEMIPEEEAAALAATVAMIMGPQSRIISIRHGSADWGRQGRRDHFASHRIR